MSPPGAAKTVGSATWTPDDFLKQWAQPDSTSHPRAHLDHDDLETSIKQSFALPENDSYVYHAVASVTLHQVQQAIQAGNKNGMHAWYLEDNGDQTPAPPKPDIEAYTSIFSSTTATAAALKGLASNAKKASLRASIAENLASQRHFPDSTIKIPKRKAANAHSNPYLDYWAWSCRALEWAGPNADTVHVKISHHVLPIFYHHFGCVCPTYEALETIRQLCQTLPPTPDPAQAAPQSKAKAKATASAPAKAVIELGSGNGYWAYLLRQLDLTVHAVDNGDSLWRTSWISDTIRSDGASYLARPAIRGGADAVLLLVYPQTTTSFTRAVLAAYRGDVICVAGTQNANGFTAFRDQTVDAYMRDAHPQFEKIVQTPLPSFAGKDEAFFVFQRKAT